MNDAVVFFFGAVFGGVVTVIALALKEALEDRR